MQILLFSLIASALLLCGQVAPAVAEKVRPRQAMAEQCLKSTRPYRWQLRVLTMPDSGIEEHLTIGQLRSGAFAIEAATPQVPIYKVLDVNREQHAKPTEELCAAASVVRKVLPITAELARDWTAQLLSAVEKTPTAMLKEHMIARASDAQVFLMHATQYIVLFDDSLISLRVALDGPAFEDRPHAAFPLATVVVRFRSAVHSLAKERTREQR